MIGSRTQIERGAVGRYVVWDERREGAATLESPLRGGWEGRALYVDVNRGKTGQENRGRGGRKTERTRRMSIGRAAEV